MVIKRIWVRKEIKKEVKKLMSDIRFLFKMSGYNLS